MPAFDFQTVLAVLLGAVFGPWFGWFAIKALRSGTTGPKNLPATRADNPALFWAYVTMYAAGAAMFVAIAVFSVTYDPYMPSFVEMAAMVIFAFCFGYVLAAVAGVTGFYAIQGFRTGTAMFVWQGSVECYGRAERPGWYWATQVQNVVVAVLLGTIGLGAIGVALFFTLGSWLFG